MLELERGIGCIIVMEILGNAILKVKTLNLKEEQGAIGICEMLFSTSLVAIVGTGQDSSLSPRSLQIVNTKRESTICELTFISGILAVKLNRKRLVVVLEEHIYIYDIRYKLFHVIAVI